MRESSFLYTVMHRSWVLVLSHFIIVLELQAWRGGGGQDPSFGTKEEILSQRLVGVESMCTGNGVVETETKKGFTSHDLV